MKRDKKKTWSYNICITNIPFSHRLMSYIFFSYHLLLHGLKNHNDINSSYFGPTFLCFFFFTKSFYLKKLFSRSFYLFFTISTILVFQQTKLSFIKKGCFSVIFWNVLVCIITMTTIKIKPILFCAIQRNSLDLFLFSRT